jgi:hypothetical protein
MIKAKSGKGVQVVPSLRSVLFATQKQWLRFPAVPIAPECAIRQLLLRCLFGWSFTEIEKYPAVDDEHTGVIGRHEPRRGPRNTVHERCRKRPEERRGEVARRVGGECRRGYAIAMHLKARAVSSSVPEQKEGDGPDDETMRDIVRMKQVRRQ